MTQAVLVLGADEFIGGKVVAGLSATGWATPIRAVRRRSGKPICSSEERVVDLNDLVSVSRALLGVSAVVNCVSGQAGVIESATRTLFDAARLRATLPRIIHVSSISVYGSATGLVNESAPLRGDLGAYSVARVAAEEIASAYPRVVIFRPGCEFGPGSEYWSLRIAQCLLAGRLGDLGAAGDGQCNVVDIEDIVRAVLLALQSPHLDGHALNLSHPQASTWNEFLTRFALALGAVPVRRISRRRLRVEAKLLAPPLKVAEVFSRACKLDVTRVPAPIPPSLIRVMSQEIRLDTRRVETALGLRWKDLGTSLQETTRWCLAALRAH
jgi:nucleoside-diphosphate-sugar epimerase